MSFRAITGHQTLLRIYTDETVKYKHEYLWRALLDRAWEQRLAGCTVIKGSAGFGPHHGFHTELMFEGAGEFTMIVEIVDTEEKIESFAKNIERSLVDALIVKENIFVRHYSHESNGKPIPEEKKEDVVMTTELNGKQTLLRVFIGEADKAGHHSLYYEILHQAKKAGLAGATIVKGIAGFGASSVIHEPHLFSSDAPVVIEIIDSEEKIDKLMDKIEPLLKGALVTEEEVKVRHYKAK